MLYRDPCRQSFENPLRKLRRQRPSGGGGVAIGTLKTALDLARALPTRGPGLIRHGIAIVEVVSGDGVLRSMSVMAMLRQLRVSDCSFVMDRSGDPQPSHLGQQGGSLQSEFRRGAMWSTNDPADLL
jgi:hypothetical protein